MTQVLNDTASAHSGISSLSAACYSKCAGQDQSTDRCDRAAHGRAKHIVQGIRQAADLASTLGSCHMIGITNQTLAASLLAGDNLDRNFIFSFAVVEQHKRLLLG